MFLMRLELAWDLLTGFISSLLRFVSETNIEKCKNYIQYKWSKLTHVVLEAQMAHLAHWNYCCFDFVNFV